MNRKPSTVRHLWGAPIAIALVSLIGLITALLGDGLNDWISWIGLSVPLVVLLWARLRRRR
jgi:type IV secretory pathway TrbD component